MLRTLMISLVAIWSSCATAQSDFPDLAAKWSHKEEPIMASIVDQVKIGMEHRQVYHIIGEPHFARWVRSDRWASLYTLIGIGGQRLNQCQMNIRFVKRRVAEITWSRPECGAAVDPKMAQTIQTSPNGHPNWSGR